MAYNNARNPLRILQDRIGAEIEIRLKDGTEYRGILKDYDIYMNIILNQAKKIVKDSDENLPIEPPMMSTDEVFIRGNNVLFINPR